jgi:glycosyltransferase involved in cell wall biosynthesis
MNNSSVNELGKEKISAVLHFSDDLPYGLKGFSKMLDSVLNLSRPIDELIVLNHKGKYLPEFDFPSLSVKVINGNFENLAGWLDAALQTASGDYLLYLNNLTAEIGLKHSYIDAALICGVKYPRMGMLYADYDLIENGKCREIHLIKHHAGRLRDNQDYGRVFLFNCEALRFVKGFDKSVKYNTLYDIRLKLSEYYEIIHVANKYAGSLYRVVAEGKKHNVFDYLLSGKDVQLEAERVLTGHLKRIGAYLKPGFNIHHRPKTEEVYDFTASVVIPVNNRPEFIKTALDSVFAQTEKNIEAVVVVNGGISDPTVREVNKYLPGGSKYDAGKPPVRLVVADINNIGLSLNLGIRAAKGKYYIQLDSDDRLKPNAVEKVVQLFESDDQIGIVIGSYEVWAKKNNGEFIRVPEIPVVTHDEWTAENGRNNLLHINGAGAPRCIPINIIKEMGYFGINDEPYARNYGEDYDLVMKISEKYKVGRIYDPIYEVVRHSGGTDHNINQETIDRNNEAKDYMRRKAIERRIKLNECH